MPKESRPYNAELSSRLWSGGPRTWSYHRMRQTDKLRIGHLIHVLRLTSVPFVRKNCMYDQRVNVGKPGHWSKLARGYQLDLFNVKVGPSEAARFICLNKIYVFLSIWEPVQLCYWHGQGLAVYIAYPTVLIFLPVFFLFVCFVIIIIYFCFIL